MMMQGQGSRNFSVHQRSQQIAEIQKRTFDLLVIGGGINGAGVARDAASRGMSVALVEASDFASGTSSRSSKLIHGGIRYLENLEFHLVFESLSERTLLFSMAPHLVHPLRFVLPVHKKGPVSMFKMGLGMFLYDALASFESPEMHERLNARETLERVPQLFQEDLSGSYVYSDAYMDDDRLVIETLRDAHRRGGVIVNYVRAVRKLEISGRISGAECVDELTGKPLSINARHVVSSVGPWTDLFGHEFLGTWKPLLRPSKGIHLTLSHERLPLKEAVVMVVEKEHRIVFAIPRHDMVIIGTTDTDYSQDPRNVRTEKEDVDYLLRVIDEYFPGAHINKSDVLASYAGVRPLVKDGSKSESSVSREHLIFTDPRNITFVVGGKYTTYRRMAEQTVESALGAFPIEDRVRFLKSNTRSPLNPQVDADNYAIAKASAPRWAHKYRVPLGLTTSLIEHLGPEAESYLPNCGTYLDGGSSAVEAKWQTLADHAIDHTMCVHLVDFFLRRSPLFLARRDHGYDVLPAIARVFSDRLGWTASQRKQELDLVLEHEKHEMAWY